MKLDFQKNLKDSRVSAVRLGTNYPDAEGENSIVQAIRQNAQNLGWADAERGAFGKEIFEGAKVVIKPNLVLHKNQGKDGLLPLVTHQSVIKAVVAEVLKANPAQVIVGDAPIQSCDFNELIRVTGLDAWAKKLQSEDSRFKGIRDFRRTICRFENGVRVAEENLKSAEDYVLFNLGEKSLLEPITNQKNPFRVTNYDPRLMQKTHSVGNHQYLVAREIIEADVVINLPKLKTHKKAGITNALKNLVGINGNKEYLPHHRLGGTANGGDCYPGGSLVKKTWEYVADQQNMTTSMTTGRVFATVNLQLERMMRLQGDKFGVEGSWSGNETVARMTLDLNRVLQYGKEDATLGEQVQRNVLHVIDAVIAGQGNGPLASDELSMGLILAGKNAPAIDWAAAHLLGYDARKVLLLTECFKNYEWQLAEFLPDEIELLGDWQGYAKGSELIELAKKQNVNHPFGWKDAKAE